MSITQKIGNIIAKIAGDDNTYGVDSYEAFVDFLKVTDRKAFQTVLPYQAYDTLNKVFLNDQSIGFGLEIMPLTGCGEEEINRIASAVNDRLPENGYLHIQLISSNKIGSYLKRFYKTRAKDEISQKLAEKRVGYYEKSTKESINRNFPFYIKDYRVFVYYCESIEPNYELQVERLCGFRESLKTTLDSITNVTDLSIESFISYLRDMINPSVSVVSDPGLYDKNNRISNQLLKSDTVLDVTQDNIRIKSSDDEFVVQNFNVDNYPLQPALWQIGENVGRMLEPTMQLSCPVIINLHMTAYSKAKSYEKAQKNFLLKDSKANGPIARVMPDLKKEHQEWDYMREATSGGERTARVVYQITTISKADDYRKDATRLKDLFSSNKWEINLDRDIQQVSFALNLPFLNITGPIIVMERMQKVKEMTVFNAVNLFPIISEWKGLGSSDGMMFVGRRGQLANWSNFANTDGNYNIAIAAKARSGKSFLTQEIIFDVLSQNGIVRVIDLGRSYEKFCKLIGGQFIEMREGVCINPFTHVVNMGESIDQITAIIATMAHPGGGASDKELSFIAPAIQRSWDKKGNTATISDVTSELSEKKDPVAQDLVILLQKYCKGGQYESFFEGRSTIDVKNRFIVLELQDLDDKESLKAVVVLSIMLQITEEFYNLPRDIRKLCVIDEAWDLLHSTEQTAKFISSGYRRVAKQNGAFATIVQSINDYFRDEMGVAVFENSDNKIILAQLDSTIDNIKNNERFKFTPYEERLLRSFAGTNEYKECLIKTPSCSGVFRVLFDPFTRILYSTRGEEFEAVKRHVNSGVSMEEAVELVAKEVYGDAYV